MWMNFVQIIALKIYVILQIIKKKEGHDNDSIQYWLTDSFVRIFL